ncbi:translation initiation factor IF-5A [Candidatus Woesearchaeota archaeon]|nr:translation initiation factor IF-5A [Candidatus Woesearchaeota archaeon]
MAGTVPKEIKSLKIGDTIVLDNEACVVQKIQVSRPGKHGHAKVRVEARGMIDGKKRQVVYPGHEHIDTPIIEKKTAQVLSISGNEAQVMDNETYETFNLAIPEELKGDIAEGKEVRYWVILDKKVLREVR